MLGVQETTFEAKYLGLPMARGRLKKGKFQSIKERMSKRLLDYSEKCMSSGAKEVLIKSVVKALPTYVMSVLINSILSTLPIFMLSFLEVPRGVFKKTEYYR